jgi:hypothetical protein
MSLGGHWVQAYSESFIFSLWACAGRHGPPAGCLERLTSCGPLEVVAAEITLELSPQRHAANAHENAQMSTRGTNKADTVRPKRHDPLPPGSAQR